MVLGRENTRHLLCGLSSPWLLKVVALIHMSRYYNVCLVRESQNHIPLELRRTVNKIIIPMYEMQKIVDGFAISNFFDYELRSQLELGVSQTRRE